MAPVDADLQAFVPLFATGDSHQLIQRDLSVRGAQGVTLGVIAAYVVGIAILWNVPYLRYILWPFKVRLDRPSEILRPFY